MSSIPTPDTHTRLHIGDEIKIKKFYEKWLKIKHKDPKKDAILKRERGYKLEAILYSILYNEGLKPNREFKRNGEQIDGSFTYNNLPFLLEAKWHRNRIPVSKILEFKGKVDGKFHLTTGIFISMSGYSEKAPKALTTGKTINILLLDQKDLEAIIDTTTSMTFREILELRIKMATNTGEAYPETNT
jgi:hypothetical protein